MKHGTPRGVGGMRGTIKTRSTLKGREPPQARVRQGHALTRGGKLEGRALWTPSRSDHRKSGVFLLVKASGRDRYKVTGVVGERRLGAERCPPHGPTQSDITPIM